MKTYRLRDIQHGVFRASQQITGLCDSGIVYKVQRGGTHDVVENAAEMGRAPMAKVRKIFDGELAAVIFFYEIQGGSDDQGVIVFRLLLFLRRSRGTFGAPPQFSQESESVQSQCTGIKANPLH